VIPIPIHVRKRLVIVSLPARRPRWRRRPLPSPGTRRGPPPGAHFLCGRGQAPSRTRPMLRSRSLRTRRRALSSSAGGGGGGGEAGGLGVARGDSSGARESEREAVTRFTR